MDKNLVWKKNISSKNIFYNRMKNSLVYINQHERENIEVNTVASQFSYSSREFTYLSDIFFTIPIKELLRRRGELSEQYNGILLPFEREVEEEIFIDKYIRRSKICLRLKKIISGNEEPGNVIASAVKYVEETEEEAMIHRQYAKEQIMLWWHDDSYRFHYVVGVPEEKGQNTECGPEELEIALPPSDYVMFTLKEEYRERQSVDTVKMMMKYALAEWENKSGKKINHKKSHFISYEYGKYCVYFPLEESLSVGYEKKKNNDKKRIIGVDEWVSYIDNHIKENPTVDSLAKEFNYSTSHFRHVFQLYYEIGVSDYIRKRKVQCAADEIRAGRKVEIVAEEYGFKSRDGFNRAFKKEFAVSPAQYGKGRFEVVDLAAYYSEYKEQIKVSYLKIGELKLIAKNVIPDRGGVIDIPAQIAYWLDKDFPSVKTMRQKNNTEIREDKIALWYKKEGSKKIQYVLGPVVDNFKDVASDMEKITISAGEYAIFETESKSDRESLAETIRMFSRCVLYGWIKENREKVDLNRLTFERYINDKIYIYVPLKEKYGNSQL